MAAFLGNLRNVVIAGFVLAFFVLLIHLGMTGWAIDWSTGPDTFVGKTIRATGTIKLNKDNPQLEITDEKELQIVEK